MIRAGRRRYSPDRVPPARIDYDDVERNRGSRDVNRPKPIAVLLAALLLASCASTYTPTPAEMNDALAGITGQNGRACVRQRDIDGFGALSDSVLSVSDKFRGHYLMVTSYRCPGMEIATAALFEGAFTEFCGQRDSIKTRDGRCPIRSVFDFESRQAAFDAHDRAEQVIQKRREAAGDG
jgi:hypothetical protein